MFDTKNFVFELKAKAPNKLVLSFISQTNV